MRFYAILICSCISAQLSAQALSFRLIDPQKKPIEGATVLLLAPKDSSVVKTAISDDEGQVVIPSVTNTAYLLYINALGYEPFKGKTDDVSENGTLTLKESANQLDAITIKAKKPMFEVKSGKLVFNVENATLATGNTALELLRKSPGVVVDQNDNISLQGKNGVRILIDGKPSPLGAADLAAQLQAMQASDIEAIEIIANPSARYDAAGNAGIINIRLKKNKNFGSNGNVSLGATQGLYWRGNANVSLNHRNKNINIFGNYGYNGGKNWNFFDFYRRQNGFIFDQQTESVWKNLNNNFKLGADWILNPKHSIGVVVNGFVNNNRSVSRTQAPVYMETAPDRMTELLQSNNKRESQRKNLNTNLNHVWAPDKNHSLSTDLDYGYYDLFSEETVPNRYVNVNNTSEILKSFDFFSETPTGIQLISWKTDWEQPLGQIKLNTGLKMAEVRTDNIFNFFENQVPDPERSNEFAVTEKINAAYVQFSGKKGKIEWQSGLRMEQTKSIGALKTENEIADKTVKRKYLDWFPSANASYNLDSKNRIGLTYSRRIDRPVYADLNPFEYRINELTYSKGNPFLLPQYTHTIELSHSWKWTLNTTLAYSRVGNYFANVSDTIEQRRSFLRKENFDKQEVISFSSSYPFTLCSWWNGFATATASLNRYRANFAPGKFIDIDNYAFSTYLQNTFTMGHGLSIEVSGSYNSPNVWGGTYVNRAFWFMDGGLQYKAEQLTLRLVVADLFLSMRWRGVAEFGGLYAVASGGWDSRQLRLNANYTFGKSTVKRARQRKSATEDLQKRVE